MYLCSQERCQIKEHVENTRLDLHLLASITSPYFIHHWIFRQHPSGVANQRSACIPDKQRDNLTTPQLLSRSIKSGLLPQSTDDQMCCTVQKGHCTLRPRARVFCSKLNSNHSLLPKPLNAMPQSRKSWTISDRCVTHACIPPHVSCLIDHLNLSTLLVDRPSYPNHILLSPTPPHPPPAPQPHAPSRHISHSHSHAPPSPHPSPSPSSSSSPPPSLPPPSSP